MSAYGPLITDFRHRPRARLRLLSARGRLGRTILRTWPEMPQCRQCAIEGRAVAASHVDHIEPHLGQWLLFFKYENTQSLCARHHKQQEKRGNSTKKPAESGPIGGCLASSLSGKAPATA
jgi:hypothetical protein